MERRPANKESYNDSNWNNKVEHAFRELFVKIYTNLAFIGNVSITYTITHMSLFKYTLKLVK